MSSSFSKFFDKMRAQFDEYRFRQLLRSHVLQDRDERKARMQAIIELSAEIHRIKQQKTVFATRLAESAIEAIVEGDWRRAEEYAADLTFHDESEELRQEYAPRFESFVATLRAVCADARLREAGSASPDN